ncbi:MAG TPA: hypothetical protein VFH73_01220 [Polyangia bacterium]|nr:hypothetical protein [Polyangia bacterium]
MATLALAVALLASAALPARAQGSAPSAPSLLELPRRRQGYYLALGLAGLGTQTWDHGKSLGVWPGSAFRFRMGQLLTRRFGLGLQIDSGSAAKGDDRATVVGVSLAAQWELFNNFALHAGTGLGVVSLSNVNEPNADLRGGYGAGYFLGATYDWFPSAGRRSGGWALCPFIQARFIPTENVKTLATTFGIEVTYWTGLPDNQLQLPESEAYKRR